MNSKTLPTFLFAVLAGLAAWPVSAQAQDDELAALRQQIAALSARLDQLELSNSELKAANQALAATSRENQVTARQASEQAEAALAEAGTGRAASWTEKVRWKGDFRYRYENIDIDGSGDRNRSRIRARAALEAAVNDHMEVAIGVASGSEDPVSSNQTLGGGGSSKDLRLDLAYFKWSGLENTQVLGGKFKNLLAPVGKNSMLWDSDWRPEGTAIAWDNGSFFARGLGTWLESDSNKGNHFAWIAEAGMYLQLSDSVDMRFGLGYHQFDTRGRKSVFGDGDFFGNSSVNILGTPVYRYDYHGLQAFGEVSFNAFGLPATAYADYVQNQEAGEFDTGYIFGLKLGSTKKRGSWALGWAWEDLEADAALGLLVDSDFGGGGTDARGHAIKGSYAIQDNVITNFTYFINEIDGDLGTEKDFNRLMLDLNFKF